jgi:uncharacterized protein with FMN-binding domain
MKKYLAPIIVVAIFVLYLGYRQIGTRPGVNVITPPAQVRTQPTGNISGSNPSAPVAYKDGTYTGDVADATYGPVQVQAVIQGGRIVDAQFLQYPSDRQYSIMAYQTAAPILKQEVIQAQNANVDLVSGATQTSLAFRVSLSSALAKAQ